MHPSPTAFAWRVDTFIDDWNKMDINIGIEKNERRRTSKALAELLANSYSLYFKTHSYHWNVEGPHFKQLHDIFQTQYTELWNAVDDIAERIRALDDYAPSTHASLAKLSSIEEKETPPHWKEMIGDLVRGNELLAKNAREVLRIAEDAGDDATADLVTPRITHHEKTAWMLRAQAQA